MLRTAEHPGRRARLLTGALAIAALLAALMALWQTQFRPLARQDYCWGTWSEESGPFRGEAGGARHRVSQESAPGPGRPHGRCTLSWRGNDPGNDHDGNGNGNGNKHWVEHRLEVSYGTGPEAPDERRAWLTGLFAGGDSPLPDALPGFVTASSGTLVLPKSCDVRGRPSVVTLTGSFPDASPARTGRLLLDVANRAAKMTGCARQARPLASPRAPGACAIPGIAGPGMGRPAGTGSSEPDFETCALAATDAFRWAARFAMTARPRIVALFDGLTGDSPPAPGWRAHGRIEATGALIRADCAGRPTVFTMRTGPGRTGTRADDPRHAFPAFVDAVAGRIGCAPLRSA
ncbi:hypothetical protein EKH77_21215 [Streptomyces luteoverticillatus]|uniref:Uncharacterized protein n=1 Tax=Streptomyces luteoverticillatus TaxID=66425 RepID=A0A3S9PLY4_STRLT|nr:hypothetical protein [Streptomyces luteoverticillatus]AZQ73400.1 hypothetical protein EKH77_21215 [Streptomyces luteoverticillatus]